MNRYFAYCPEGGFETFDTIEARDKWAEEAIDLHLDDGWSEYVDQVCVGEITARATKTNERPQPKREEFATEEEYDDAISDWGGDTIYDSICDYELLPIGAGAVPSGNCGTCGEPIHPDRLTGTTCACARAGSSDKFKADPHVKSSLPAQAGGAPVTPSALESALAKLREPTLWAPVTTGTPVHVLAPDEAAALLQRLEAADSIPDGHLAAIAREAGFTEQQFASLFYNDGPYEITTPTATLRCFVSAILAYHTGNAR